MDTNYQEKQNFPKKNNNAVIYILGLILIAGVIVVIVLLSKKSPYEQGTDYLRQKQYSEALSEFQKVDAGNKDFRLAQSKINYINGLMSFNDSLMQVAAIYLMKVDNDDEYRHDADLMLDKIRDLENKAINNELKQKDTLIIKQEITDKTKIQPKTELTDLEINKRFISQVDGLINKFESQYQSARTAPVSSKREYMANMNSTMSRLIATSYSPKQIDFNVTELKRLVNQWMDKRIAFIDKLLAENSIGETNNSRSLKEEGDKLYFAVTNQMKKVKNSYSD